jgi:hypothetical protein
MSNMSKSEDKVLQTFEDLCTVQRSMAFQPILVSLLNMDLGWGNTMDSFFKSDQTQCVVQLLSVYQEGRQDGMKHVVSTSCLCHSLP